MNTKKMTRKTFTCAALCGCAAAIAGCATNETARAKEDLGAYCGLHCGSCPMYTGGKCTGCKGPTETLSDHCKKCEMRPCAQAKGVKSFAECKGFPCAKTEAFHNSGKPMGKAAAANCKVIQESGYEKWLAAQSAK
ncbi:hypothetical protein PDESU_06235 [Pontiella desulfatans]|uniref:DUF3795 domain-containing protein n=1 Tax=Pontiella desulfatans TaxID=2750659 RepID=A0A6C2UE36_PONDE|nr:DUF3795 domain-containing protein [Pontiella desulfatans]VGO17634.1 hypothetical protein PDESU_06235 [Pontiella desulfatans]